MHLAPFASFRRFSVSLSRPEVVLAARWRHILNLMLLLQIFNRDFLQVGSPLKQLLINLTPWSTLTLKFFIALHARRRDARFQLLSMLIQF